MIEVRRGQIWERTTRNVIVQFEVLGVRDGRARCEGRRRSWVRVDRFGLAQYRLVRDVAS